MVALLCAGRACAEATLIDHVHGYTLAAQQLRQFDALVFEDGKVLRTGSAATLRKAYPDAIESMAAAGLLPGLIDAHGHVLMLGFTFVRIQLFGTDTLAEAQQRIRAYAKHHPERTGIWGTAGIR